MAEFKGFDTLTIHLSYTLGTLVVNKDGQKLGKLSDLFVNYDEVYPIALAIQVKKNGQYFYINFNDIITFGKKKIVVPTDATIGRSRTYPKVLKKKTLTGLNQDEQRQEHIEYPGVGKLILDKQIIDSFGKKVVRVNDIELLRTGGNLRVTHAAIGLRSMIRRLGWEDITQKIMKTFFPKSNFLKQDSLINWKHVMAIPGTNFSKGIKLNLSSESLKDFHPADIADILEDIDAKGRELIFDKFDYKMQAEVLSEVDDDLQGSFLQNETPDKIAAIIENMGADEAADFLAELDKKRAQEIISQIKDDEFQEEVNELLVYDENTAGGIMTTDIVQVKTGQTVKSVINELKDNHDDYESIYDIFVIDPDEHLLGFCTLKDLLISSEELTISEIFDDDVKTVGPNESWKQAARAMSKYNLMNLPIVDTENKLLGAVSVDDILPWLLDE